MGIELPQYVVDDPIVRALNQSANDLVASVFLYNLRR